MRGGIDRAAAEVARERETGKPVLFIDGGDALFTRAALTDAEIPQEELKARAIADAFKWMKLATRAAGDLDDARGPDFRKSLHLPDQAMGAARLLDLAGRTIAVVSARTELDLIEPARRARREGAVFVIGLLYQSLEEAQRIASNPSLDVDVIFATRQPGEFGSEDNRLVRTPVPAAQIQDKGRSLARLDLVFESGGGRFELLKTREDVERELSLLAQRIELLKKELNTPGISEQLKKLKQSKLEEWVNRRQRVAAAPIASPSGRNAFAVGFIPLESSLPGDPDIKSLIARYERDVGVINLQWARQHGRDCPPPQSGEAAFVGNDSCRSCHEESFPVWDKSKHAHAYRTLENLGRQYDLSCVGCHVTGYDRSGGVCRVDRVEQRKDVGCESCHGPGSLHADDPDKGTIAAKPEKWVCVRCHNPENSSHFDFATYLPKILGPGHQSSSAPSSRTR